MAGEVEQEPVLSSVHFFDMPWLELSSTSTTSVATPRLETESWRSGETRRSWAPLSCDNKVSLLRNLLKSCNLEVILVGGGRVGPAQGHRHAPRHPDRPHRDHILRRVGGQHSHTLARADQGREAVAQLLTGSEVKWR